MPLLPRRKIQRPTLHIIKPSKPLPLITIQHHSILPLHFHSNPIIRITLHRVKIKHKHQSSSFKHNHLILLMLKRHIRLRCLQPSIFPRNMVHRRIEIVQILVSKKWIVNHVPLTPRIVERVPVTLSWKIEPLQFPRPLRFSTTASNKSGKQTSGWPNSFPSKLRYPSPPRACVISLIILCSDRPRAMTGVIGVKSDMCVSGYLNRSFHQRLGFTLTHLLVHQPERNRLVTH